MYIIGVSICYIPETNGTLYVNYISKTKEPVSYLWVLLPYGSFSFLLPAIKYFPSLSFYSSKDFTF